MAIFGGKPEHCRHAAMTGIVASWMWATRGCTFSTLFLLTQASIINRHDVDEQAASKCISYHALQNSQDQLAQTLYCMAELQDTRGKLCQADQHYKESLQLQLESDSHRQEPSNRVHCAMCLAGMGRINFKKMELKTAAVSFQKALMYGKAHRLRKDHAIVTMIQVKINETQNLMELRSTELLEKKSAQLFKQGDWDKAESALATLIQIRKDSLKMLKARGECTKATKYAIVRHLKAFGDMVLMKCDKIRAEKAYRDALKLLKHSGSCPHASLVSEICRALAELQILGSKGIC
jgi:tetratricopeptide (TPR) repeat protein